MSSLVEFAHLRLTLKEILEATNNFSDENLISLGTSTTVYTGKLLRSKQRIDVAVRRSDPNFGEGHVEFFAEISNLSRLEHENLISIIGFCDENGEKITVINHEANASLDRHLSSPTLTWMQRLHICVGAASGLTYLHKKEGRNYGVIHRNVKSSKILLDENWNVKISGFAHSLVTPSRRRHRLLLSPTLETSGYVDPVSIQTGSWTYKSDSYSFGIVLFEVLCGRLCMIEGDDDQRQLLAPLVKRHYDEEKLDEIIPLYLRKQMNDKSLSLFSETAYYCLKEQRTQRPDMDQIARKLHKALEFQQNHENPEPPLAAVRTWSNHVKENFGHLKIPLEDIKLATSNFDQLKCIGTGGYGEVYKAQLDYFDYQAKRVDQNVVPKTRSIVAIKRIKSRQDTLGEQGFLTEIEMLTSCDHPNVVSLLGFCDEGEDMILVYEYASKGSLSNHLGSIDKMTNFTWTERLQMCLNIAQGLNYLHTKDKQRIIHRDIKSDNILLDNDWVPKIADFGLSKFGPMHQEVSYLETNVAGTDLYLDPEYECTRKLKKESDIYSFGVVLFEIMCGRLAYDEVYYANGDKGLPSVARRHYNEKTLKEIIDPKIMEETDENVFTLNKGPNEESLNTFLKIACQCLAETQQKRPTMEVIIKELQKALDFQANRVDILKISQEQILLATENFSEKNIIGKGAFGDVYKGEVVHAHKHHTVALKRHVATSYQGEQEFLTELEILFEYKHENVIGLVGYYNELDEKIIIYEHAVHGSLDKYLRDDNLTWAKRIKICIDVTSGLNFLHGGVGGEEMVIHRDIKSSNILLDGDWKAKISDFGLSMISPVNQDTNHVICNPVGTFGYVDRLYIEEGYLTKECDIFSLGVVLLEIMCGRLVFFQHNGMFQSLHDLFKRSFKEGRLDGIVFDGIRAKIVSKSLILFSKIVYQCLHDDRKQRPTTDQVVVQLKEALDIQEDYDIWEPKLPRDYKEIIKMSNFSNIDLPENKRDTYNLLCKGLLLQNDKVWFSLSVDGLRNEMISATTFSFNNPKSCKWSFTQSSRFSTVAEMLDISDMKIEVKITCQYLSLDIIYGAYLVFKFCDPRKLSNKPVYVNLKYQMGSKTLHSYFATWRDDEWMMIELDTFLNHKKSINFEVLLESFSQNCRGSCAIFVEGIEFRAIDHVKHGEVKCLKRQQEVLKSMSEAEKIFSPMKVSGNKCHMLPATMVLYDHSNVKCFKWLPLADSRFVEVAELLDHQVFWIKCKIESESLSSETDYACYLVFKLSQECHGLQCPVKVRDVLLKENKETKVVYFRSLNSITTHDIGNFPNQREDGLMEVIVWELNSSNKLNEDHIIMNLKLRCYEGTMSGLIVCGIEFRPL